VAAFNEYGPDGFLLRSRPGGPRLGAQWLDPHSTVIGVAESGQVRAAFLRYVDDVRATDGFRPVRRRLTHTGPGR